MTTRRSFLKTSTVLSAGLMIAPSAFKQKKQLIGLQLYTVRDAMAKDPKGCTGKGCKNRLQFCRRRYLYRR